MIKEIRKERFFILEGSVNSGKSTRLMNIISNNQGRYIGFVTTPGYLNGEKIYFINGINIPHHGLIASRDPVLLHPPLFNWRHFIFSHYMFDQITEFIIKNAHKFDTIVIDEIGPLEFEGKGWNKLFDFAVKSNMNVVVTTRNFKQLVKNLKFNFEYDIL